MTWERLHTRLDALAAQGRERQLHDWTADSEPGYVRTGGRRLLDLASNDYLGLSRQRWTPDTVHDLLAGDPDEPVVLDALTRFGAGAARLINGNHPVYGLLERDLARLKGREAALIFGSGVAANTGVIPALMGQGDAVFSDELNHASIIDGVRLSRAETQVFPHRDLGALERQLAASHAAHKLIVTDALFSMDGTLAALPELVALKKKYGAWLMVDEAHTGGVYGSGGAGLACAQGVSGEVDVLMGTLGKAYGSVGAYIAGDDVLIRYLLNAARSFIFTTGLPPVNVAVSLLNVRYAQGMDEERRRLHAHAARFRAALSAQGLDLAGSESQVVPVVLGAADLTLRRAEELRSRGYGVVAIRPPTVAPDSARLRFALSSVHRWEELEQCAADINDLSDDQGSRVGAERLKEEHGDVYSGSCESPCEKLP
ncbi:8-amino-7-oxononanoate synthase [Deinococcus sp.]|uniref:aminotransferase class I/II-fold pyridoxal phosphate-dependent enzyme n=1 Tax=Deinococcus sp. TaxID=47478 RepID=UPI0025C5FE75|nr:8-amino-7-oxononanoate synthase [Deinococcus sp.]